MHKRDDIAQADTETKAEPGRAAPPGRVARVIWRWNQLGEWPAWIAVGALTLGLFSYRVQFMAFYVDEAISVALARQHVSVLWRYIWGAEQNMAIYYVLLHEWLGLLMHLGITPSEALIRLPTIVCMALAAVVILRLGWRFWHPLAGLVAAVLFALSPLILQYAQEARSYGLQVLLVCLAWYSLLAALDAPGTPQARRWWAAFAGMSALSIYAQLISVLIVGSQGLLVIGMLVVPNATRNELRHAWRTLLMSFAGLGLMILPMALDVVLHGGDNGWVPAATPQAALNFLTMSLTRGSTLLAVGLVVCALSALALVRTPTTLALAGWLLLPFALCYAFTQPGLNVHLFWPRYLVDIVPALCLLVGVGLVSLATTGVQGSAWLLAHLRHPRRLQLTTLRAARMALALTLALCLLTLAASIPGSYYATAVIQHFHRPLTWLETHYHVGDGIICHPEGTLCAAPLDYYLHIAPLVSYPGGADPFPIQYAGDWPVAGGPMIHTSGATFAAYLQQHPRVFVVTAMLGDVTQQLIVKRAILSSLIAAHYQEVGQDTTPSVQVYLYVRTDRSGSGGG